MNTETTLDLLVMIVIIVTTALNQATIHNVRKSASLQVDLLADTTQEVTKRQSEVAGSTIDAVRDLSRWLGQLQAELQAVELALGMSVEIEELTDDPTDGDARVRVTRNGPPPPGAGLMN